MRFRLTFAIAVLAAPFVGAAAGHATPVLTIKLSEAGFSSITSSGVGAAAFFPLRSYGTFVINSVGAIGAPFADSRTLIDLDSLNVASKRKGGTLVISLTETGLRGPIGQQQFDNAIGGTLGIDDS